MDMTQMNMKEDDEKLFFKNLVCAQLDKNPNGIILLVNDIDKWSYLNKEKLILLMNDFLLDYDYRQHRQVFMNCFLQDLMNQKLISKESENVNILEAFSSHAFNINNTDVYIKKFGVFETFHQMIKKSDHLIGMAQYPHTLLHKGLEKIQKYITSWGNEERFDLKKNSEGPVLKITHELALKINQKIISEKDKLQAFHILIDLFNLLPYEIQTIKTNAGGFRSFLKQQNKEDLIDKLIIKKSNKEFWSLSQLFLSNKPKTLIVKDGQMYLNSVDVISLKIEEKQEKKNVSLLESLSDCKPLLITFEQKEVFEMLKQEIYFFYKIKDKFNEMNIEKSIEHQHFFEQKHQKNMFEFIQNFMSDLKNYELSSLIEKDAAWNAQHYYQTIEMMRQQVVEVSKEFLEKKSKEIINYHQVTQIYIKNQLKTEDVLDDEVFKSFRKP